MFFAKKEKYSFDLNYISAIKALNFQLSSENVLECKDNYITRSWKILHKKVDGLVVKGSQTVLLWLDPVVHISNENFWKSFHIGGRSVSSTIAIATNPIYRYICV